MTDGWGFRIDYDAALDDDARSIALYSDRGPVQLAYELAEELCNERPDWDRAVVRSHCVGTLLLDAATVGLDRFRRAAEKLYLSETEAAHVLAAYSALQHDGIGPEVVSHVDSIVGRSYPCAGRIERYLSSNPRARAIAETFGADEPTRIRMLAKARAAKSRHARNKAKFGARP